jgi:hypothetical protein
MVPGNHSVDVAIPNVFYRGKIIRSSIICRGKKGKNSRTIHNHGCAASGWGFMFAQSLALCGIFCYFSIHGGYICP